MHASALSLFDPLPEPPAAIAARGATTPIPTLALAVLQRATFTPVAGGVSIDLPSMPAEVYARLKPILATFGIEWKRRKKTHLGSVADVEAFQAAIAAGAYAETKRYLEFFATSNSFARTLAELLANDVYAQNGRPRILEPSAGDGALVAATLEAIPTAQITAVEIDERRAAVLARRFAGDERVRVVCADILTFAQSGWDGIIANPPFEHALAHLQHITGLARRGAFVVTIASLARRQDHALANWVNDRANWTEETPPDAFVDTTVRAAHFGYRVLPTYTDELAAALVPYPRVAALIEQLKDASRDIHWAAEDCCNGDITDDQRDAIIDERLTPLRATLRAAEIGIHLAWDPRAGYGFGLVFPDGKTNDLGQSCIIVPGSWRATARPPWPRLREPR